MSVLREVQADTSVGPKVTYNRLTSESGSGAWNICSRTKLCLLCSRGPRGRPSTRTVYKSSPQRRAEGSISHREARSSLVWGSWEGSGDSRPRHIQAKRGRGGLNHPAALAWTWFNREWSRVSDRRVAWPGLSLGNSVRERHPSGQST